MRTVLFPVSDMQCAQCEVRLETTLRPISGVSSVKASLAGGTVSVSFDPPCSEAAIREAITRCGYTVSRSGGSSLMNGISILVIIFGLWYIANSFGFSGLFQRFPMATEGMGYAMLFAIGLLTSFHCIAMCGGLHLAAVIPGSEQLSVKRRLDSVKPAFLYNAGRLVSYTALGGLLGAVGSVLSVTLKARAVIGVVAAAFMLFMGIRLMNCFPVLKNIRFPRLGARLPVRTNAFAVGLCNGLMPCGPLQTMQLLAVASGSAAHGALSMFSFCLGTLPLLLAFGIAAGTLGARAKRMMSLAGGALIILFSVAMLQNDFALLGIRLSLPARAVSESAEVPLAAVGLSGDIQTITTPVKSGAYQPFRAKAGVPLEWHVSVADGVLNGCNNEIVIPDYNISVKLHTGDNIVSFTPQKSGRIPYTCWMGMIRSYIVVEE